MSEGAPVPADLSADTIFDKIVRKEIKSDMLYEDDVCVAIRDINPVAPTHFLVIPKEKIPMLSAAKEDHKSILGHMMLTAAKVAEQEGLGRGYRLGCQSVYQIHIHVVGGTQLGWPPC